MSPLLKLGFLAVLAVACTACGVPPDLRPAQGASVPQPSSKPPSTVYGLPPGFTPRPSASPMPSPFPMHTPAACAGSPSAEQVAALLKRETGISPGSVLTGPICSGAWHYTVYASAKEPLHVVSMGPPASMILIAAGSDVCNEDVMKQAPLGIRTAAAC